MTNTAHTDSKHLAPGAALRWHRYSFKISSPYDAHDDAMLAAKAALALQPEGAITDTYWSTKDGYLIVHPTLAAAKEYLAEMCMKHDGTMINDGYVDLTHPGCCESSSAIVVRKAGMTNSDVVTDDDILALQNEAQTAGDLDTVYLVNCALDRLGPAPKMPSDDARARLEAHIRSTRALSAQG